MNPITLLSEAVSAGWVEALIVRKINEPSWRWSDIKSFAETRLPGLSTRHIDLLVSRAQEAAKAGQRINLGNSDFYLSRTDYHDTRRLEKELAQRRGTWTGNEPTVFRYVGSSEITETRPDGSTRTFRTTVQFASDRELSAGEIRDQIVSRLDTIFQAGPGGTSDPARGMGYSVDQDPRISSASIGYAI